MMIFKMTTMMIKKMMVMMIMMMIRDDIDHLDHHRVS